MENNRFKGTGAEGIPTRRQKKLLKVSLNNKPETSLGVLADQAGVSRESVYRWFKNPDFELWWIMEHYEGARGLYVEKLVRKTCQRALSDKATAKDIELAFKILAPERLNKVYKAVATPQVVVNFVGHDRRLDMPHIEGKFPEEPQLIDYTEETGKEEIIDVEADVA